MTHWPDDPDDYDDYEDPADSPDYRLSRIRQLVRRRMTTGRLTPEQVTELVVEFDHLDAAMSKGHPMPFAWRYHIPPPRRIEDLPPL